MPLGKHRQTLSPRSQRFLRLVAEGIGTSKAAQEVGLDQKWASTVRNSPAGQAEITRLVGQLEGQLVQRLPSMLSTALDSIQEICARGSPRDRLEAASFKPC